jgi:hypothetical protein
MNSVASRAKLKLGCQVWFEPTDSPERVDHLFAQAAAAGLGWVRLFLIWPWIEAEPDHWDFGVFDRAFEAAQRHGILIKATLTANSGPWHIGTPSALHSFNGFLSPHHREAARVYIEACVHRYAGHPALGQWMLWNEPSDGADRTPETLERWQGWLQQHYADDLAILNRRWLTGYPSFEQIPFPEQIPHQRNRGMFNSYAPWLADWRARAAWLNAQIAWVGEVVRAIDSKTETCINPTAVLANQAQAGTDLSAMGALTDVLGASYHPTSHFTYAPRSVFPALMVAGVRLEGALSSVRKVEVSEVQSGNTLAVSIIPSDISSGEIARFYLAGLAGGAASVTGWCLNMRSRDVEAGDYALLDDLDGPSSRSRMLRRVHDRIEFALERTGAWSAAPALAHVVVSPESQAVEWADSLGMQAPPVPGRLSNDSGTGAGLLAASLMRLGLPVDLPRLDATPTDGSQGGLLVLSQVVAWNPDAVSNLLAFTESGGTLLLDATSGRKNLDAAIHRPWPGGLTERLGFRAVGLESRPEGHALKLEGLPAGRWLLGRLNAQLSPDAGWVAWDGLRFARDGEPCVWERPLGKGRVLVVRGIIGPSLVHPPRPEEATRWLLERAIGKLTPAVKPIGSSPSTIAVPVQVENGTLVVVLADDASSRAGKPVRLRMQSQGWLDLWTGEPVSITPDREACLEMPDGVALLWNPTQLTPSDLSRIPS